MWTLFQNKDLTALVTGGSRGIGRAISQRLAASCAKTVFVNYLENDEEAFKTRKLVEDQNASCLLLKANLAFPDEIDRLFEELKVSIDHLDIFVHCAAVTAFKPLNAIKANQWDLTFNVNARSFLLCAQKAAPLMRDGRIVAISSLGSQRNVPNYGAMGPTKAALESVIKYLAVELAPRIRVNGISSGPIEGDSIRKFPDWEKMITLASAKTPSKRLGTPDDIADVVLFLISPLAKWICGQIIVADGGLSLL